MPTIRRAFPFAVETIDPQWITLPDGLRLAATLWRPVTAQLVPVVVEMVPYRRRDGTVFRDLDLHPYWAGCGIAMLRVDLRGSGDSDGILSDEYTVQEQEDACAVIAWAAAQSWCNGKVGMTGISWGGFNALQVAARRPPALKAIITLCASDDRYSDDVHYMGGALLTENEMWSNFMLVKNAMPPDPQICGARWREMWLARLEANRSWSGQWLRHQRRDDYWRQGSVCENYARIACPVLALCGWEDSYSNFVPRLLANLKVPRLGIVGPWSHSFPCRGDPGPRIGYCQEALRWWQHWLCGVETAIMQEPLYRVWIGGHEPPQPCYREHAGHWAAESQWPSPRIHWQTLHLNASGLEPAAKPGRALQLRSPATAGTDFGRWGGYGGTSPDLAIDQRREDGQALCFDTEPLEADLTLLGAVVLDLELTVDQPLVNLTARLCDVAPGGASGVFTCGVLNLSHRNGHDAPEPCPVGQPFRVRLQLNDVGRTIPKGHRLRLALQTQFWFVLWPQPRLVMLELASGASSIRLPVRPPSPADATVQFAPAELAAPVSATELRPGFSSKTVEDDLATGVRTIRMRNDHGETRIDDRNITTSSWTADCFSIHGDNPLSARMVSEYAWAVQSGEADIEARSRADFSADETHFHLTWRIEAREGGELVHEREETVAIKRDFC